MTCDVGVLADPKIAVTQPNPPKHGVFKAGGGVLPAYRLTAHEAEDVTIHPDEVPPPWLRMALRARLVCDAYVHGSDYLHLLVRDFDGHWKLVEPGDWIVLEHDGHLNVLSSESEVVPLDAPGDSGCGWAFATEVWKPRFPTDKPLRHPDPRTPRKLWFFPDGEAGDGKVLAYRVNGTSLDKAECLGDVTEALELYTNQTGLRRFGDPAWQDTKRPAEAAAVEPILTMLGDEVVKYYQLTPRDVATPRPPVIYPPWLWKYVQTDQIATTDGKWVIKTQAGDAHVYPGDYVVRRPGGALTVITRLDAPKPHPTTPYIQVFNVPADQLVDGVFQTTHNIIAPQPTPQAWTARLGDETVRWYKVQDDDVAVAALPPAWPAWLTPFLDQDKKIFIEVGRWVVHTQAGPAAAHVGDFIIRRPAGELAVLGRDLDRRAHQSDVLEFRPPSTMLTAGVFTGSFNLLPPQNN